MRGVWKSGCGGEDPSRLVVAWLGPVGVWIGKRGGEGGGLGIVRVARRGDVGMVLRVMWPCCDGWGDRDSASWLGPSEGSSCLGGSSCGPCCDVALDGWSLRRRCCALGVAGFPSVLSRFSPVAPNSGLLRGLVDGFAEKELLPRCSGGGGDCVSGSAVLAS